MPADGGELYLASGWAIYNELLAKHPDAVQVLSEPWVWQESRTLVIISPVPGPAA